MLAPTGINSTRTFSSFRRAMFAGKLAVPKCEIFVAFQSFELRAALLCELCLV